MDKESLVPRSLDKNLNQSNIVSQPIPEAMDTDDAFDQVRDAQNKENEKTLA